MKRRMIALLLTLVLTFGLSTTVGAYTDKQLRAADALNHLDLFRGTGLGYELDKELPREQGPILILRVIGKEAEAKLTDPAENPFTDISANHWGVRELTYANKVGLVNGRTATTFDPKGEMSDYMFLTLLLRQLGYKDNTMVAVGDSYDFIWNSPYALAKELGIVDLVIPDGDAFTRGDAALLSWKAMEATFKGTDTTLAESLIAEGVFTAAEYAEARDIWIYGYILGGDDFGAETPNVPSAPDAGDGDSGAVDGTDSGNVETTTPEPKPSGNWGGGRV